MSKLKAALEWAARGFAVFPLAPNSKEPAFEASWYDFATTDETAIRRLWTDPVLGVERDFNIGVDCTGLVVVDVDVKNGKPGHNEYVRFGGDYQTLVVQTASGGYHCYYNGPDSSNAPIASAVDIRSHHGYVVAPGSVIDGVTYTVVRDRAMAWVPETIARALRPPYSRKDGTISDALDSPASIEAGRRYLETAPPAIEGQRGNETTFVVAARLVRELALSVDTAFELMAEVYNPRCTPTWAHDELRVVVENANAYGSADMGRLDPSVLFANVEIPPPPSVFAQSGLAWGNARDPEAIAPRPWMIDRLLLLNELSMLIAPGSAGKSTLGLAIVAHLAAGRDFGPYKVRTQCKSIVYNGEDDVTEQSRRLYAVCDVYGLDYKTVAQNVMLLSAEDFDMRLVIAQGGMAVVNEAMVQQLIDFASAPDVGLVLYDPLVDIHEVDEGDSPKMNAVMRLLKRICKQANVASLVMHHSTKAGSTRQDERIGNMDISRGASGIVYKVRIAYTLLNASQQDAEDYGMQDGERAEWVRLDDAKMNLTLASDKATWFRKLGVRIPSGDVVGVLKHSELTKDTNHLRLRVANVLIDTLSVNGTATMTVTQAVSVVKAGEPLWSNKTDTDVKKRLEGMFSTPVEVRGQTLQLRREGEGNKTSVVLVLS